MKTILLVLARYTTDMLLVTVAGMELVWKNKVTLQQSLKIFAQIQGYTSLKIFSHLCGGPVAVEIFPTCHYEFEKLQLFIFS